MERVGRGGREEKGANKMLEKGRVIKKRDKGREGRSGKTKKE